MIAQRTLKTPVELEGVALHSGKTVKVALRPASPGRGISFTRTDLKGRPEIPAHYENVVNTRMATTLAVGDASVSTVEHLMAALQGMGIDNLRVEVDGPEIPIFDGSALPICRAIQDAGIQSQAAARSFLALRKRVELKIGENWAVAEPSSKFEIHGSIEWDHPAIGYQQFHYVHGETAFSELSAARTFGFVRDIEALHRMGLARGGTLENAIVLDDARVISPSGLRYPDEFVRHKVLDALGDLKLAGIGLQAMIRLHRAGHDMHRQLLSAIFRDPDSYEIVDSIGESRRSERVAPLTALTAARGWAVV
jgi:UDP-3-O-[3-hydroxymyristoyl] N-acetylglucosamine deacetylase